MGKEDKERMPELETERKFLVHELPVDVVQSMETADQIQIDQGYTILGWRVRKAVKKDGTVEYTVIDKVKTKDPRTRLEVNPVGEISEIEFESWWAQTEGGRISKIRYLLPLDDLEMHLDVFTGGHLDSRMLVEVEFPPDNPSSFDNFVPPTWFGREVTGEFSNHKLALGKDLPLE